MTIKRKETAHPTAVRRRAGSGSVTVPETAVSRSPQHARGRERVERILDAATAIILEDGMVGLTIEAIAKRSETAKSSMYHFFTDRKSVIAALGERLVSAIAEHMSQPTLVPLDTVDLNAEEFVDLVLEPIHTFIAAHPEVLVLMPLVSPSEQTMPKKRHIELMEVTRIEQLLVDRVPAARPAERRAFASALFATIVGVFQVGSGQPALRGGLQRESRAMMIAGFDAFERRSRR